jgi:hypothetical protein
VQDDLRPNETRVRTPRTQTPAFSSVDPAIAGSEWLPTSAAHGLPTARAATGGTTPHLFTLEAKP